MTADTLVGRGSPKDQTPPAGFRMIRCYNNRMDLGACRAGTYDGTEHDAIALQTVGSALLSA
jgi:hypothetical protein